jgi:hypothetical protein
MALSRRGPDGKRVQDVAPGREPAFVGGGWVKQHSYPHVAQRLDAGDERRMAGELGLAVWDGYNGDAVPGIRWSVRTGSPVSPSSTGPSMNLTPIGVEKTKTRHPAE